MPLELVVEKVDALPEAVRGLYVERDGKFHLDVNGVPDVKGLQTALQSERERAAGLDRSIKDWARLGKKPDEVEAMLESERKKAEDAAIKAGRVDEVIAKKLGDAKMERDAAVGGAEKQRDAALGIARSAIRDTRVNSALVAGKATEEGLSLLPSILGNRIQVDFADDGSATVSILDTDGKTPMVGSGKGGLATFDDLVKEAAKKYPSLFEGTGAGGGGANPNNRKAGAKEIKRADFDALGPVEKSSKIKDGWKVVD